MDALDSGGSLFGKFVKFSSATVISLLVYALYSMVDGLFISHGVGEYAMSAVNIALPYTNILFSISVVFGVGGSVIISMLIGSGNRDEANRIFSQNCAVLVIIGVLLTALTFLFMAPFTEILGAGDETRSYVREYLSGIAPFSVFFIVSYTMEILIKADGFPRRALFTVIAGCLFNCVFDYVTIFILKWGVFGAALATGASQLFVCVIYFFHFTGKRTTFRFVRFRPDLRIYLRLLPIGVADAVTELFNGAMILLFNRTLLRCIGADGVVSYTVIAYINTVVINVVTGVSAGAQPLISFNYARNDRKSCRRLFAYVLGGALFVELAVLLILRVFGASIVRGFLGGGDPALISSSLRALSIYSVSFLMLGLNISISAYFTAHERSVPAMAISVGRGFAVQAPVLLAVAGLNGGDAIWFTPVISEAICLVGAVIMLFAKRNEIISEGDKNG